MDNAPTSLPWLPSLRNDSVNGEDTNLFDISACPEKAPLLFISEELFLMYLSASNRDSFVILIVFPVIILFGLFANLTFLWTVYRVREMRTFTNFYLANLAVSDILLIISTAFTYIYPYIFLMKTYPQTQIGCILSLAFVYLTYFTSIGLVTLVSLERFLAICYPLKHRMVNSKSRTITLVVLTWSIGALLAAVVVPAGAKAQVRCVIWPTKYQIKYQLSSVDVICLPFSMKTFNIQCQCRPTCTVRCCSSL